MAMATTVEQALTELQRDMRLPDPADPVPLTRVGRVPDDLAPDPKSRSTLSLRPDSVEALELLRWLLPRDLRFEYMDKHEIEAATCRFACLAELQREDDHLDGFLAENAHEQMELTCFFPVLHLAVPQEFTIQGARLIPAADAERGPVLERHPQPAMASVIAVECRGTDYVKMSLRSAEVARHALRLLRAGLREERFMPDSQLRFRLGESYWFSDGIGGWQAEADTAWPYEADEATLQRAASQPIASLPVVGTTDVERCANRALRWFEQAQLAIDPLMEVLLLFFALEAILGTKSGGPKARPLARRRAVLAHNTAGGFAHPIAVWALYKDVRNEAVHGSEAPEVSTDELGAFSSDVRRALNQYLDFARARDLSERDAILDALDRDPDAPRIERDFLPQTKT